MLLLWRFWDAGSTAVILKQTYQTLLHRICQRHINITLLPSIGAAILSSWWVGEVTSWKTSTWDRQLCRCWRASCCTAEQTAADENKSLTSIMHVFKWGACSIGYICIDSKLDLYTVFNDLACEIFLTCHITLDVKMKRKEVHFHGSLVSCECADSVVIT